MPGLVRVVDPGGQKSKRACVLKREDGASLLARRVMAPVCLEVFWRRELVIRSNAGVAWCGSTEGNRSRRHDCSCHTRDMTRINWHLLLLQRARGPLKVVIHACLQVLCVPG